MQFRSVVNGNVTLVMKGNVYINRHHEYSIWSTIHQFNLVSIKLSFFHILNEFTSIRFSDRVAESMLYNVTSYVQHILASI